MIKLVDVLIDGSQYLAHELLLNFPDHEKPSLAYERICSIVIIIPVDLSEYQTCQPVRLQIL